ncbi:hypothetical protein D1007_00744 [Hordeum vulgare]|nr:hypothetical protein D1007_00744 [Hordeum vulgare]
MPSSSRFEVVVPDALTGLKMPAPRVPAHQMFPKWIDINHLKKDPAYFGDALCIVYQLRIEELITFQQNFDYELVAHFFAIVHFHTDDDQTMTG